MNQNSPTTNNPARVVIPTRSASVDEKSSRVRVPVGKGAEPVIETHMQGKQVHAIDIRCTCGQHTRLICEYDS
ncbi:MAG: hypothetical protein KDA87_11225 [Planctomycetales bacterium]|nr:hypothetical protein [Planctomycetales bacterium]